MANVSSFLLCQKELSDCFKTFAARFPLIKPKENETDEEKALRAKVDAFEVKFKEYADQARSLSGTFPNDRIAEREIYCETLTLIHNALKLVEANEASIPPNHRQHLHRWRVGSEWCFEQPYQRHWSYHSTHGELIRHK